MLKFTDFLRPSDPLKLPYRGKVVGHDRDALKPDGTPRRLGRVKVQVEGLLEGTVDELPWIYQKSSSMLGGRNDLSSFAIPEIGAEVIVEFPYGDVYAGFYSGYWQSENTHQGYLDEDYPHSYGFRDIQNTFLKINKAKKFLEFQHASGARFFIDADSTIEMMSDKAIKFVSKDRQTEFTFDMISGEMKLNPKAGMELGGQKLDVKSKEVNYDVGNVTEKIGGGKSTQVAGGVKLVVGSGYSESILSSKAESVGFNKSTLIGGTMEEIIGLGRETTIATVGDKKQILLGNDETELILGNYKVNIIAGNIDISTIAGSAEMSNLLGKVKIGVAGDIEVSNLLGSLKIDPAGQITMDSVLSAKVTALINAEIKATVKAEIAGQALTVVGSGASITQVNGSLVLLGGLGGLPVARVGDQVIGIGNLGIPVISTIILGSFKVLSA